MNKESLVLWPMVFIIYDVLVPETMGPLMEALKGLEDSTCAITFDLWGLEAEDDAWRRQN